MKRSMSKSQPIVYTSEPISSDYSISTNDLSKIKKDSKCLCGSSRRRMYIFLFLSGTALLWIFIYYKLLNHRFALPEPLQELQKMFGDGEVKTRRSRLEETETVEIHTNNAQVECLPQFKHERSKEVVFIVLVACNHGRVEQAIVSMKAIIAVTNSYIFFHIFTDEEHYENNYFENHLKKWPSFSPQRWMMFVTHPIHYPIKDEAARKKWHKLFKPCASQRLFLPSILANMDTIIYIDTDVIFLKPPEELWLHFKHFNQNQLAGAASECGNVKDCWYKKENKVLRHPFFEPNGINSGVMLMNLTRMRQNGWVDNIIQIYHQYEHVPLAFGDQDILNIFFQKNRDFLYELSCQWNYRPIHCLHQPNVCKDAEKDGIAALQGNHEVFMQKKTLPEFYFIYKTYLKFKSFKSNPRDLDPDFQKDVVSKINDAFKSDQFKKSQSFCNQIANETLRNIQCSNT